MMNKSLSYNDVCLVPLYSELDSRDNADTSVEFAGRMWNLPVVPANMSSCIDQHLYKDLIHNDYFAIMHRFGDNYEVIKYLQDCPFIAISVGVKDQDYAFIKYLSQSLYKVDCICVDIANGWSVNLAKMVGWIRKNLGNQVYIIGGNVPGNPRAVADLI